MQVVGKWSGQGNLEPFNVCVRMGVGGGEKWLIYFLHSRCKDAHLGDTGSYIFWQVEIACLGYKNMTLTHKEKQRLA